MGRTFSAEDAVARSGPDNSASIVVSYRFWLNALSGDKDAIGRTVRVSGRVPAVIVGVLPKDFRFTHVRRTAWLSESNVDVWLALPESTFTQGKRDTSRSMLFLARLKPGVTMQQAQAALDVLSASFRQDVPAFRDEEFRFDLRGLRDDLTTDLRPVVLLIAGAATFLMLLVCLNVSNLLLVRAKVKGREDAVRAAVGCGKVRLYWRAGCESLLLALCGRRRGHRPGVVGRAPAGRHGASHRALPRPCDDERVRRPCRARRGGGGRVAGRAACRSRDEPRQRGRHAEAGCRREWRQGPPAVHERPRRRARWRSRWSFSPVRP